MTSSELWLIAAVVCVIIEILPPPTHFGFLGLAFGALAASIVAFFSPIPWLPWAVFCATSVILIPLLIPLAKFLFMPRPHASNADALLGQKALVLEAIRLEASGSVKINGEVWRARTEKDSFEKDQWVEVLRVDGTHLIVRRS